MLIKSLLTTTNPFNSTAEKLSWIQQRNQDVQVNVKEVPFSEVEGWYQGKDGSLHHDSGKFFSIEGIQVETTMDGVRLGHNLLSTSRRWGVLAL